MRRSLRFASLSVLFFLIVQLQTSCSPRISGESGTVPPAIELTAGKGSQKYNIQLDFMKHHLSGMLIVRRMPENEIRILASTYFGLSLFDFSLRREDFLVNSCVAPMQKEKVLKLLEMTSGIYSSAAKGFGYGPPKTVPLKKEPVEKDSGSRSYPSPEKLREIRNK